VEPTPLWPYVMGGTGPPTSKVDRFSELGFTETDRLLCA
jgi:hypothetical protein